MTVQIRRRIFNEPLKVWENKNRTRYPEYIDNIYQTQLFAIKRSRLYEISFVNPERVIL